MPTTQPTDILQIAAESIRQSFTSIGAGVVSAASAMPRTLHSDGGELAQMVGLAMGVLAVVLILVGLSARLNELDRKRFVDIDD